MKSLIFILCVTLFFSISCDDNSTNPSLDFPEAPSNLMSDSVSFDQIHLSWTDNSDNETGFYIERKLSGAVDWFQVKRTAPDIVNWADTDLVEYFKYYYRVFAFNDDGNSVLSDAIGIMTEIAPPQNLTAEAIPTRQIELTWHDRSDVEEGFIIERRTDSEGEWQEVISVEANEGLFTDTELEALTVYEYRICANIDTIQSAYSNITAIETLEDPLIVADPDTVIMSSSLGMETVLITNGGGGILTWVVMVNEEDQDWLSIASAGPGINDGAINFIAAENIGIARSGEIIVSSDEAINSPISITIIQSAHPPVLNVSSSQFETEYISGSVSFVVLNNGGADMEWSIVESIDWLSVYPESGVNNAEVIINYVANTGEARVGEITIQAPDATPDEVVVVLSQGAQPILTTTPDSVSVGCFEGTAVFLILNDGGGKLSWTAATDDDWLSVDPDSGEDIGAITVSFTANTGEARQGNVTITAPGAAPESLILKVLQSAPSILEVSETSFNVNYSEGSEEFTISNTGSGIMYWEVTSVEDWLSFTPSIGYDDKTVTINYEENTGEIRVCEILISTANAIPRSATINFTQINGQSSIPEVEPDSISLYNSSGSTSFFIRNAGGRNLNWQITEYAAWFDVSPTSGVNDAEITIEYDQNNRIERRALIDISFPDALPNNLTVLVEQDSEYGRLSSVDPDHADQGETLVVSITGIGTHFRYLSEHAWSLLQNDSEEIRGRIINRTDHELLGVEFDIPNNADVGMWDVEVGSYQYQLVLPESFEVVEP